MEQKTTDDIIDQSDIIDQADISKQADQADISKQADQADISKQADQAEQADISAQADQADISAQAEPADKVDELTEAESKPVYLNLVLSGGSTRGIAQIGAVYKLIEEKLLDLTKLKGLACSSAGSMLGVLIVLGFTIDEIWSFIYSIDFTKLVSPNIFLFPTKCGIESGQKFYNVIEEILTRKTTIDNITFEQLYRITSIAYTVVGSCLTTKEAVYYNHINTPDFKVSLAIRISMSIPGFFVPVVIDGKTYIDGALIDNYPIELFHGEIDRTIGIIICNDYDTDYKYPEEYCGSVMNLLMWMCYKKDETKYKENTIYIRKNIGSMPMFDFNLSRCKKNQMYQSGVSATEEFIAGLDIDINK